MRVPTTTHDLSIDVRQRSDGTHLCLMGRFDVRTRPALDDAIDQADRHDIVMDLAELTFMDGAGWLALMALEHRVHDWGGQLSVVNVPWRIRKIFEATDTEYLLAEPVAR